MLLEENICLITSKKVEEKLKEDVQKKLLQSEDKYYTQTKAVGCFITNEIHNSHSRYD